MSGTWPQDELGKGITGLVCELKQVVGGMDKGLFGLYMKGGLNAKLFTASRNHIVLGGGFSPATKVPKDVKHRIHKT